MPHRVAVLDPDHTLTELLAALRASGGVEPERLSSVAELLHSAARDRWDVVFVDWDDPASPPPEALRALVAVAPELPVVVTATTADVARVQRAIDEGAVDFLVRGSQLGERVRTQLSKIRRLLRLLDRNRALASHVRDVHSAPPMLGSSPAVRRALHAATAVARIQRPVLILGERGTGKELIARHIHEHAGDEGRPFVAMNCGAVADSLLENELFGHERGSYTGADQRSPGRFEQADGGTLFLDEIGNMSLAFQQAVLRAVEYGCFQRVGSTREVRVNARIVAATNADLPALMARGAFLQDLYDRLSFEVIRIPPLRERPEDVAGLAAHFLRAFGQEFFAEAEQRFSEQALDALRAHAFPGNVRELKNLVERAAFHDVDGVIGVDDLALPSAAIPQAGSGSFKDRVASFEARVLREALDACEGNQAAAARQLQLSYHQLRYFVAKHGLVGAG